MRGRSLIAAAGEMKKSAAAGYPQAFAPNFCLQAFDVFFAKLTVDKLVGIAPFAIRAAPAPSRFAPRFARCQVIKPTSGKWVRGVSTSALRKAE
jgi:hypothetical protein